MVKRSIEQNLGINNFGARSGNFERNSEIMNQGTNSVNKEFLENVGNGKPTGIFLKETLAVSVTISISVQNRHSRILLRVLLSGRMREMRREPEAPEVRVPVEERLGCPARITSKAVVPILSVKNGILQNACSTSVGEWMQIGEKCSYAHRQVEEEPSKMSEKEWWHKCISFVEEEFARKRVAICCQTWQKVTRDLGDPISTVILGMSWNEDLLDVDHVTHDNWVAYFRIWSRRSLQRFTEELRHGNRSDV